MPPSRTNSQAELVHLHRSLLRAGLHDASILASGVDQRTSLADIQRQRLLAVDILASLTSQHAGQHVVVVHRGNHHRIQILLLDQLAIILIDLPVGLVLLGRRSGSPQIGIADRGDASGFWHVHDQLVSTHSHPDNSHQDLIVGPWSCRRAKHVARNDRGNRDGRGRRQRRTLKKSPPGNVRVCLAVHAKEPLSTIENADAVELTVRSALIMRERYRSAMT